MKFDSFNEFVNLYNEHLQKRHKFSCCSEESLKNFYNDNCKSFKFEKKDNKIVAKDFATGIDYEVYGEDFYFYILPLINNGKIDPSINLKAFAFMPSTQQMITIKAGMLIREIYDTFDDEIIVEFYDANALNYITEFPNISYKEIFNLREGKLKEIGLHPDKKTRIGLRDAMLGKDKWIYKKSYVVPFIEESINESLKNVKKEEKIISFKDKTQTEEKNVYEEMMKSVSEAVSSYADAIKFMNKLKQGLSEIDNEFIPSNLCANLDDIYIYQKDGINYFVEMIIEPSHDDYNVIYLVNIFDNRLLQTLHEKTENKIENTTKLSDVQPELLLYPNKKIPLAILEMLFLNYNYKLEEDTKVKILAKTFDKR